MGNLEEPHQTAEGPESAEDPNRDAEELDGEAVAVSHASEPGAQQEDDSEWLGQPADLEGELSSADLDMVGDIAVEHEEVLFADVEEPAAQTEEPGLVEVLNLRISEMDEELRGAQQRMLRLAADHENFRRRSDREKDDIRRFGIEKVLVDLLPVMDNFERALSHGSASQDRESLLQGVEMVRRQFENVLRKHGCEGFDSVGKGFDPQRHEAVHQIESAQHEPNTVIEEYHRGYHLQERLIRPALVAVSKLPPAPQGSAGAQGAVEATPAERGNGPTDGAKPDETGS